MISTAVQNLVDIRPWGGFGANRRNINYISFFIYTPFLSNAPTGQTAHHIFTLNGSNDADSRKGVPFWLWLILWPILGIKLPNNPNFWGVNRDFLAKRAKYWNVHIIKTTASIITKLCREIETPKYSLWVVQICPKQINLEVVWNIGEGTRCYVSCRHVSDTLSGMSNCQLKRWLFWETL